MNRPSNYGSAFVRTELGGSLRSADVIIPIVAELVPTASVVDVGCGNGAWLRACLEHGSETVCGYDVNGLPEDEYLVPATSIRVRDLEAERLVREKFDLAICLEVAEHLTPPRARTLVSELASMATSVLFSAAIPRQPGTGHINLQWPSYWRTLFGENGMAAYDVVRPRVWSDDRVEWWYRQNTILYSKLELQPAAHDGLGLDLVHPELWRMNRSSARARQMGARVGHRLIGATKGLVRPLNAR